MSLRPSLLDPLFAPATALPGVGPKIAPLLDRLARRARPAGAGRRLLFHLPTAASRATLKGSIADAPVGEPVTLAVTVDGAPAARRPARSRAPYQRAGRGRDRRHDARLLQRPARAAREAPARRRAPLRLGQDRDLGRLPPDGASRPHPRRARRRRPARRRAGLRLDRGPVLAARRHASSAAALERVPDAARMAGRGLARAATASRLSPRRCTRCTARPTPRTSTEEALAASPARRRLAYDELLASQLALALVRSRMRRLPGRANAGDGRLAAKIRAALPFGLTGAQDARRRRDPARPRLATSACCACCRATSARARPWWRCSPWRAPSRPGGQAALMAPTEILARQHFERIAPLAPRGRACASRCSPAATRAPSAARRSWRPRRRARSTSSVGTHALFQEGVAFRDLGLAVVDEQHRFGVHQRLALGAKGEAVDMLVMTATPIPRTLALTYFGDMDVSVLDEKPAGRKPIATRLVLARAPRRGGRRRSAGRSAGRPGLLGLPAGRRNRRLVDLAAAEDRYADAAAGVRRRASASSTASWPAREKDAAMARFAARRDRDPGRRPRSSRSASTCRTPPSW